MKTDSLVYCNKALDLHILLLMLKSLSIFLFSILFFSVPLFAQNDKQKMEDLEKVSTSTKKYIDAEFTINPNVNTNELLKNIMEEASLIYPMDFSNYKNFDPFADHDKESQKKLPNDMSKEFLRFVYYLLSNNDENVVYLLDPEGFNNDRHFLQLIDYIKELTNINDDKELFKFILGHYNSTENKKGMWGVSEIWFKLLEKHYFHNIRKLNSYEVTKPNGADCINFSYEEDVLASLYIKRVDIYPYVIGHVVGPKDIDKVIEISVRRHDLFTEDLKKIKEDQINSLLGLKRTSKDEKLLKKIDKLLSYYDDDILAYSSQQEKYQKDLDLMEEENWTYLERQIKREEILIQGKQNPQLYDPKFLEKVRVDYVMDVLEYNENIELNDIMYIEMKDIDKLFKIVDSKVWNSIAMQYGIKYRKNPVHELKVTNIETVDMVNDNGWSSRDVMVLYGKINGGRRMPLSWLFYTMYSAHMVDIDLVYTLPELRGQHLGETLYNDFFIKHKEVGMVEAILGMENHSEFYKYLGQKMGDETISELETIGDEETHEILINAKTDQGNSVADLVIEAINSTPLGKHNSKMGFELEQILFYPRGEHVEVRWTKKSIDMNDFANMELPQDKKTLDQSEFFDLLSSYTGSASTDISELLDLVMKDFVNKACVLEDKDEDLLFGSKGKKGIYDYLYTLVKQGDVSGSEDIKFFLILSGAISINKFKLVPSDSDIVVDSYVNFGILGTDFNSNSIINNGLQKRTYINNPQTLKLFKSGFELMKTYNKGGTINIR